MDCRLPIVMMLMMILWCTHFSYAQSPDRCQCNKFIKSVKPSQIVSYSITPQTINCKTREIQVKLSDEKMMSCLNPNEQLAKRLLFCTQKYGKHPRAEEICLCRLKNYPNTKKCHCKLKGSHVPI